MKTNNHFKKTKITFSVGKEVMLYEIHLLA